MAPVSSHDEKPAGLDRRWDPQLDQLGEFLEKHYDEGAMDLEELDGFFAALHCCPELVMPSEYLPVVLGDFMEQGFMTKEEAQNTLGLVMQHWNAVGEALRMDDVFVPLLLEDEHGKAFGHAWALGFLRGVEMRKPLWREILGDDNKAGMFIPLFALVYENDPDPKMRPYKKPMTDSQREKLLAGLSVVVSEMYDYFGPARRRAAAAARHEQTFRREQPKIRRNDPCYCGSGRKYKKCCGALRVN